MQRSAKNLAALEMELTGAKHDGFVSKHTLESNGTHYKKRPLAFIGIFTGFDGKKKRDVIRKQWFPTSILSSLLIIFVNFFYTTIDLQDNACD